MKDFVHLHVHTQYSILDGQASIPNLVEKALKDGMRGMAVTDHGNMMGIKEFYNYVKSKRKSAQSALKDLQEKLLALDTAEDFGEYATREEAQKALEQQIATKKREAEFKPIFGCEMYVARRGMRTKECKEDQSGWHLIVLAKMRKDIITSLSWCHTLGLMDFICVQEQIMRNWKISRGTNCLFCLYRRRGSTKDSVR